MAHEFIEGRNHSSIGAPEVRAWARRFPPGASVLDLGCGSGVPISQTLFDAALNVSAIDASPTLCDAFHARFPNAPIACEAAESSQFFNQTFDGIVAWGLVFLLRPEAQRTLIRRIARALRPSGRFLFTAPSHLCTWTDISTGRISYSLGSAIYVGLLAAHDLAVAAEYDDEGDNHYYDAIKVANHTVAPATTRS